MSYADLIERLEKLEGPDRETDWLIASRLNIPEPFPRSTLWPPFMPGSKFDKSIPLWTTSLDAAVNLQERVLPGWDWGRQDGLMWVSDGDSYFNDTKSKHPAIALLIATLKALSQETSK